MIGGNNTMNNDPNNTSITGGVISVSVLSVVFIILKLFKVINWPWIWVLCPLWGPIVLTIGLFGIITIIAIITDNL